MCGIITMVGNNANSVNDITINAMLSSLSKRGSDDRGFVRSGNVVLGQTRLSIVDIIDGKQPMKDNKSPLTVVFNGEIYGYKELRKKLEVLGHVFSTNSDTEVILKSYAEYGYECLEHLDGMFAFAIWDETKQELFVARDRFGKKPFYYTVVNGTLIGASEIKAIFVSETTKGKIDYGALDNY